MPLASNYGGVLQNYALQQILIGMGHTPITLNYMPSLSFGRYLLYVGKALVCLPFPSLRHPIKPYRHYIKRPPRIELFVQKNINLTKTVPDYSKGLLRRHKIESIVLGSDQVWRFRYNSHYIEDMYLNFAKGYPCVKIAYGASFGIGEWDYPDDKTLLIKELIKLFNAVSVREESGVVLCREHLGIDAKIVLDPTLLLRASDYEVFCTPLDAESEPYLASYVLDMTDEKRTYIELLAKSMGLKVKRMAPSKTGVSVEEWLSTIRYADFVITDSYHGSLFSIIFGKQFQTIVNSDRGADRFQTLFNKLNLQKCLLYSVLKEPIIEELIDYYQVNSLLSELRKDSIAFLSDHLK